MATGQARTYNLKQTVITVGGLPVEGFSEDDAVTFTPDAEEYTKSVGADGEVTRSRTNNFAGTFTFMLKQTSRSNDLFNTFLKLTRTVAVGDIFPISIKDLNGGDFIFAEQCWIESMPEIGYGREAGDREWTIATAKASVTLGGALR